MNTVSQVAAVADSLLMPTFAPGMKMPTITTGESSSTRTGSVTHQGSELTAGNDLILAAQNNVHIVSGELNAGNNAKITGKDVTFDTAINTYVNETSYSKSTVGGVGASIGKDEVTLGGLEKTKQTTTERTTSTTHDGTQINAGNLVVLADNNINFIASDVNVAQDATLQAGNKLNIEGRADSTTTETHSKTETTTLTAGVKNAYVDTALAADALVKAGEDVKRAESALRDAEKRVKNGTLAASALDDYKINLAAANTQLGQATLNLTAAGGTAVASTATGGFYATGSAEHSITEQSSTTTGQEYQGSSFNIGGNASFKANNEVNIVGSSVNVGNTLTLDAEKVNLRADEEHHSSASSQRTTTAGISGSTSGSGSLSANASHNKNESESHSKTHVNSQISAGNLNSDSKSFTLAGANVEITNDINLNTQHLTVDSVQDTHQSSSKGSSQSVGVTAGGSSINPSSAGYSQNSSSEDSQWVNNQTTLIGGGKVNINADKTTVTGAVIANASRGEDGTLTDHGNMNLVTDELIINDLQDYNRNDSKGIDLSAGLSKSGTSSVGLQKGGHNTEQTTYATLGGGTVTKKSGEQHDLTNTNRDLNNTQEITLDQQTAGLDATVTVDHRLLSEGGRNAIKEDIQTSVEAVEQATNYVVTEIKVMGDNLPEELRGSLGKTGEELVESLIRQGLSKEQIKEVLSNENLLLGLSGVEQSNQELNGVVVSFSPVITDSTNSSIEPVVSYQPDDTSNNDPIILDPIVVIGVGNDPTVLQVGVDGLGRIQQEIDKLRENNPSAATAIETAINVATGGPLKAAVGQAVNYGIEQTLGDSISQVTNQITEYAASLVQNTDLAEFRDGTAYERDTGDLGDLGVSYTGTQDGIRLGATLLGIGAGAKAVGKSTNNTTNQDVKSNRNLPFGDTERLSEINKTLDRIDSGSPFPYSQDGTVFKNREGKLPNGNYREYTVETPGSNNRGARRIVQDVDTKKTYYTDDHYNNFIQIDINKK